jgi:PEP-CTERM motif
MTQRLPRLVMGVAVVAAFLAITVSASADQLYNQPWDGTGNAYSSQNDPGTFGNFATVYDNFTLGAGGTINDVQWYGEYFNPPVQGPILDFTVAFYADSGGVPGTTLFTETVSGTANETFLTTVNGFPVYTYDLSINPFVAAAGTQYWVSVEPTLFFPPQWGWSSGTGGDGAGYQCFFGACSSSGIPDLAFTLNGSTTSGVPEPGSLLMLGSGLLGLAGFVRRKLS